MVYFFVQILDLMLIFFCFEPEFGFGCGWWFMPYFVFEFDWTLKQF